MPETAPSWGEFIESWSLFSDPIYCAIAAGAVLGFQGVFIVLRRMVFVTAAISQSAALGVALAFYAAIHFSVDVPPILGAIVVSLATTFVLALRPDRLRIPREGLLGLAYAVAGGATVLVGDRISQEAHDISSILFGTAVLVRPIDLQAVLLVGAAVTVAHLLWHRGFVLAGFDPDAAKVQHVPVAVLDAVLWGLVALEVSVATRALGALPVFAFAVLPALGALSVASRMSVALLVASALGIVAGAGGYLVAYFWCFPVGASQSAVAGLLALACLAMRRRP